MDRRFIGGIHFEIKCLDLPFPAKCGIKLHQPFSNTQLPILRMNANIEKFGFVSDIPKTYKTYNRMVQHFFRLDDKTISEWIPYLLNKHIL
jgi:hypothetical protein